MPRQMRSATVPLLATFTLLALGLIAIGVSLYRSVEEHIRLDAESQLSSVADLKIHELVQWREERLADGAMFSRNPVFAQLVHHFFEQPHDAVTREHLRLWLATLLRYGHYNQIRLLDTHGATLFSIPDKIPPATSHEIDLIPETLHKGEPILTEFYRSHNDQQNYLATSIPLFDPERGNAPLGVLSLRINPNTFLFPYMLRWPTESPTAQTLLVRRDGDDVLHLNDFRHEKGTALTLRQPLTRTELPAVQAVLGTTGIVEGRNYRGDTVIADVRGVPNSSWFLVTRIDATEVYGPAQKDFWMIAGLTIALLVAVGAGMALLRRNQHIAGLREKARITAELKELSELFALFMQHSPVYVFIKDVTEAESHVIQVSDNFEQLVGMPAMALRGKTMAEIFPAEFAARMTADDWTVASKGVVLTVDEDFNGRHYTTVKFPIRRENKVLLAGFTLDITERKQAEEDARALSRDLEQQTQKLLEANQELEAFSYTLSHDLRSYLGRIQLAAELLSDDGEPGDYLPIILDACSQMDELISTMLSLAKLSQQELQCAEFDLSAMAAEICLGFTVSEPKRTIRATITPGLRAQGDPKLLQVVLENLLGNACKYTRERAEAHISLTASQRGEQKVFAVADNGIGFNMEEATKIFQPFQRLANSSAYAGFGIGLTTVQRIIQRHGGEIWAESSPGHGSTFYFTLPQSPQS